MASGRRILRDSLETILLAVFVALFVRTYIVTGYKVPGSSMAPTLWPGDLIFSYRPAGGFKIPLGSKKFGLSLPDRGDVLVLTFPDQPRVTYVRRAVGLPGDKVEIQQGKLILNDQPLEYAARAVPEEWRSAAREAAELESGAGLSHEVLRAPSAGPTLSPFVVPPGEVFVMSDRRIADDDPHDFGLVPLERIEGRVFLIWLSLDWEKHGGHLFPHIRSERILKPVH